MTTCVWRYALLYDFVTNNPDLMISHGVVYTKESHSVLAADQLQTVGTSERHTELLAEGQG